MRVSPATDFLMCKGGCAQFTRPEAHPPLFFRFRSLKQKPIGDFTTMTTSNHSSRPAYSRVYNLTGSGSRLAHYLDYLNSRPLLQDLAFADLLTPDPAAPPEHHDIDRAKDEADRMIRRQDDERDDLLSHDPEHHDVDRDPDPAHQPMERDDIPGWVLGRDDDEHGEPEYDDTWED